MLSRRSLRAPPQRTPLAPLLIRRTNLASRILRVVGAEPCLIAGSGAVLLPAGKPFAALCLIVLEPAGVTREDLAAMLWPDTEPERARASVRQALHVIRKAVAPGGLEERGGRIRLVGGQIDLDLDELQAAVKRGDLEDAHARWDHGPFSHFSLADTPAFNEWSDRLRGRWEQRLGTTLAGMAQASRAEGDIESALTWTRRALDVRPYHEADHLDLTELLIELGRIDEAEEALHRASAVTDGGASARLEALQRAVQDQRRARFADPSATPSLPVLEFVGRTQEIAELRSHWRSVLSGRPRSIALLGPAGVGKTRLAEEFARHLAGEVAVVGTKAIDSERDIEFGLVAELAKELAGRPGAAGISNSSLAALQQLVPSLGNGSKPIQPGQPSEVGIADALLDLIEAVAHEAPLILVVDDLQWGDPRSRTLLLRVARSLRGVPVMTLFTCRSGDADLSAVRTLRSEGEAGRMTNLHLSPLPQPEVSEALALSLKVLPDDELDRIAHRLHDACQGNPLFLAELIVQLHRDDVIVADDGGWALLAERMPSDLPLPSSVREILERRITVTEDGEQAILRAMLAGELGRRTDGLLQATRLTEAELKRGVAGLLRQGLVVWGSEESLEFAHDSIRETARALLPPPRGRGAAPRIPAWLASLLVVIATISGGWAWARTQRARPPLYPGIIMVSEGNVVHRYRLPAAKGSHWDTLPSVALPSDIMGGLPVARYDGGLSLLGMRYSAEGVPAIEEVLGSGKTRALLQHEGDVTLSDVSPDGRFALLNVADETGEDWRQNVVRYEFTSGDTLTILKGDATATGRWSEDGSMITGAIRSAIDTLVWLRPNGQRVRSMPWHSPWLPVPCGPDPFQLVGLQPRDGQTYLVRIHGDSGTSVDVGPLDLPWRGNVLCSPDGRAVVLTTAAVGGDRLVVLNLQSGDTLIGPSVNPVYPLYWRQERPVVLPASTRLSSDSLTLDWGDSHAIRAITTMSDGTTSTTQPVEWRSLDSRVASVREPGTLYANGVGTTRVIGSIRGWIEDTLTVRVRSTGRPSTALLAEDFSGDLRHWTLYGNPQPAPLSTADGPVLDMRGDGVGFDGLVTTGDFDLSRGATLELEYRLALTRHDRQSIMICLETYDANFDDRRVRENRYLIAHQAQSVCFAYPFAELTKFDSTEFAFRAGSAAAPRSRPDLFPTTDWRHVTILLAPDGNATLLLDRQEAAHLSYPLYNGPGLRWRVNIIGRAADTQLLVRNLVLWEGMRY